MSMAAFYTQLTVQGAAADPLWARLQALTTAKVHPQADAVTAFGWFMWG